MGLMWWGGSGWVGDWYMISLNRKGLMGECVQYGRGLSTYPDDMQIVPDNYELA